ncbi:MAG TPA: class I SAM-dependent methyltransferase [Sphingomonas sp.]
MADSAVIDARATVLALLPRGALGMEVGVWKGQFSRRILNVARPTTLHLVDPWRVSDAPGREASWYGAGRVTQAEMNAMHDAVVGSFATEVDAGRVRIHRGPSSEVLSGFPADSLDFVYIDGDHSHEGCSADLEQAFRLVKPGGLICADDYSLGQWWGDGVVRAVNEFAARHPVKFQLIVGTQVVIRKLSR